MPDGPAPYKVLGHFYLALIGDPGIPGEPEDRRPNSDLSTGSPTTPPAATPARPRCCAPTPPGARPSDRGRTAAPPRPDRRRPPASRRAALRAGAARAAA